MAAKKQTILDFVGFPRQPRRPIKENDHALAFACLESATSFLLKIGVTHSAVLDALDMAKDTVQHRQEANTRTIFKKA
jgi:hypothetical protein